MLELQWNKPPAVHGLETYSPDTPIRSRVTRSPLRHLATFKPIFTKNPWSSLVQFLVKLSYSYFFLYSQTRSVFCSTASEQSFHIKLLCLSSVWAYSTSLSKFHISLTLVCWSCGSLSLTIMWIVIQDLGFFLVSPLCIVRNRNSVCLFVCLFIYLLRSKK